MVSAEAETAHNLEHSIANAALPNVARVEAGSLEGPGLARLVRRVDVIVCSTSAAERVQGLVGSTMPVIIDDRALNQRAIQMLGAVLARDDGHRDRRTLPSLATRPRAVRASLAGPSLRGNGDGFARRRKDNPLKEQQA